MSNWIVITWIPYNGGYEAEVLYNPDTDEYKKWDSESAKYVTFIHNEEQYEQNN